MISSAKTAADHEAIAAEYERRAAADFWGQRAEPDSQIDGIIGATWFLLEKVNGAHTQYF